MSDSVPPQRFVDHGNKRAEQGSCEKRGALLTQYGFLSEMSSRWFKSVLSVSLQTEGLRNQTP